MLDVRDPREILARVFGFPDFRGLQSDVVAHVNAGGDALVLMPTGGGKSVCYQVPALCRPGTALVISPLIALMDDQVAAMRELGVAASSLHSEMDQETQREVWRELEAGRLDLLYLSPERLLSGNLLQRLARRSIALVAIDEAHCVSQWGHEFRPEYRLLACLPEHLPGVPRIALTATADPRTREDILASLNMPAARVFTASFHRPNLNVTVAPKESESGQLMEFLAAHKDDAGIVYVGSRAKAERTAERLRAKGIVATAFHAGLAPEVKRAALMRFRSGEAMVVVATIAFGMGIDRPDVRFVVHLDMPNSPESYYQQIGRAGRDGDPAETLLLYGAEDIARARHFLSESAAPESERQVMRARLEAMIGLVETVGCRTRSLLACFGEEMGRDCGHCDNCLAPPKRIDGTVAAQKVLSAIYRTGQMFGALHIISVLRGQTTEAVIRHGHDKLPTFGIGVEQSAGFWRGVIRHLVSFGALRAGSGEYPGLELETERARPILRGEEQVFLREDAPRRPAARDAVRATALGPHDEAVFQALRSWRARVAAEHKLPPYVIFHDSVLRDISGVKPATLDELGGIKGVGASKLERYGGAVLAVLAKG